MQSVREDALDLTGWLAYFAAGLATQPDEVSERGKQAMQIDFWVQEYGLNQRQVIALRHISQNGSLSGQELQILFPDVSRRTLQRDLKALLDTERVKVEGSPTNRLIYRMADSK